MNQFTFCEVCVSEEPGVHKPSCMTQILTKQTPYSQLVKEFIIVNVYKHSLPRLNGCPLADNQCTGCQLSIAPSGSYHIVSLCEKNLGGSHHQEIAANNVIGDSMIKLTSFDAAQVSYCIDMSEDLLKVECQTCN